MNLIEKYDAEQAAELANRIISETKQDLDDRREWDKNCEEWTKLWACQPTDRTNPPWEGSANTCIPLVASACEQAHNRAYAAFFDQPAPEQVRCLPVEEGDIERAKRVEKLLNWQTGSQIKEFEVEMDRLMTALPKDGIAWKKWWWCDKENRPKTMFIPGSEVIVPYGTKPHMVHEARRITHRYKMHATEIQDAIKSGFFYISDDSLQKKIDDARVVAGKEESIIGSASSMGDEEATSPAQSISDSIVGVEPSDLESDLHTIYERHEDIDIDGDKVPVIIWVDMTDGVAYRMIRRGTGKRVLHQFVDYHLIWNPHGFYSFGYGHFLASLNNIGNTIFNQYIDSGKVSNLPFVFYTPGAGFRRQQIRLAPGEGVPVRDIAQVKVEKMPGLDGSLAQLLTFIDRYGSDISDNTDEARGRVQKGVREPTVRGQNARMEQTLMGFGVKIRRMISSMQRELEVLYNLDALFLEDGIEHRILGTTDELAFNKLDKKDFDKQLDIIPTASPGYTSRAQRRQEMLEMTEILMKLPNAGAPRADGTVAQPALMDQILKKLLETYSMGELGRFIPDPPAPPMPPGMEHARWLEGEIPKPTPGENHAEHLTQHQIFLMLNEGALGPEMVNRIFEHISETQELLKAKMQAQQAPPVPFGKGVPTIGPEPEEGSDFAGQPPMGNA